MNINHQLAAGDLVAKGFLAPHNSGQPEKIIPIQEWRFLKFQADTGKAEGPNGVEYFALMIGRPIKA